MFCLIGEIIKVEYLLIVVWNGVIFVTEGFYEKGIFKFQVKIPDSYPSISPEVFFITKVLHPMIDSETGEVDVKVKNLINIEKISCLAARK
jgi:ubiquitin-protein ligase